MKTNSLFIAAGAFFFGPQAVAAFSDCYNYLESATLNKLSGYTIERFLPKWSQKDHGGMELFKRDSLKRIWYLSLALTVTMTIFQPAKAQTTSTGSKEVKVFSVALTAKKYIIPNGDTIAIDKLDSVIKSWHHAPLLFHPDRSDPEILYVRPQDSTYYKSLAENKSKIESLLNKLAPDFTLKDLNGRVIQLAKLRGQVVVLNFWFTTCGACITEMPELNKIKSRYKSSGVVFLALALDNPGKVREFLRRQNFAYTLVPDATQARRDYKVFAYPTSMVVGKNGLITYIYQGFTNVDKVLSPAIDQALIR